MTATGRRFFLHLNAVFGIQNFPRWARVGGWGDRYEVVALTEGDKICATIGVTVMEGWLGRRQPMPVFQLGAVATRPQDRGRGLARRLLEHVLAEADRHGTPVLLFANPSVVDFYPRFGFRRLIPDRLFLQLRPGPETKNAIGRRFDPETLQDRALLAMWCDRADAHGGILAVRPDASILLWHLMNTNVTAYVLPKERGLAFVEVTDRGVMLCDCLSRDGMGHHGLLQALAAPYGGRIELGFVPDDLFKEVPENCPKVFRNLRQENTLSGRSVGGPTIHDSQGENGLIRQPWPEAYMFWRGPSLPEGILHFPALMMT
ncbi:GNAT family N-acetyltransferase [Rhizobium sp. SSA_523]|uniref:GNAT family N-acetyltransferase n=1 Tax=Rhizobium sp. SSA_523 TaxID=2952477 RepID=UPI00209156AD|nr:GNAT family N-acetyltransferase [Rhizobium sp. SSA_523]MCO5732692.1 GNAT family N-acetyltransferase [Rhizobium sp. SSA_523]WKC23680.1 GNAT family N-acetyltransferase [Rhizobium sp. SSA_523]